MRARLALLLAQQTVRLRAVVMKDKPDEMLAASPKGTVPVLILEVDGKIQVLDESLDIMLWALQRNDPKNLMYSHRTSALPEMLTLIRENDEEFKPRLEMYKRAKRFHDVSEEQHRCDCEPFVQKLEQRLDRQTFMMGTTESLLDYALLPFVRQFSRVNRQWFLQGPYTNLQRWLRHHLDSPVYAKAMTKYPLWLDSREECLLGEYVP